MSQSVRVRFAPSPTGHLHIGGVRTALFNWLFARRNKGSFILRIEDTDRRRSKKRFLDEILNSLRWLELDWDEGPYFQTQRLDLYRQYARQLLKNKKAYRLKGQDTILFKVLPEQVEIDDLVHGEIKFDNSLLKDFVIQKSDGYPTYNFACVIDDYEMKISHVVRGDDHISNTPKQIALYRALNLNPPRFAHIPLIIGRDRKRLSKRGGATAITYYRKEGYLSQAMVNFLALMGWSPGNNQEIIGRDELISKFSLEKTGKTSAVFNLDKLNWMNSQYIKRLDLEELIPLASPFLKEGKKDLIRLFQDRIKTLSELKKQTDYFFLKRIQYTKEARRKITKDKNTSFVFKELIKRLKSPGVFNSQDVENLCRSLIKDLNIPSASLIHPVRAAVTGRTVTPGLFEVISLLGREKTIERLKRALGMIRKT
jgi:glutamyl-tRNA synthetase